MGNCRHQPPPPALAPPPDPLAVDAATPLGAALGRLGWRALRACCCPPPPPPPPEVCCCCCCCCCGGGGGGGCCGCGGWAKYGERVAEGPGAAAAVGGRRAAAEAAEAVGALRLLGACGRLEARMGGPRAGSRELGWS